MKLFLELMRAIDFEVTDSGPVGWDSYPDARYYDCNTDHGGFGFTFSTVDQKIYEITANCNGKGEKQYAYRWINPDYLEASKAEHIKRDLDFKEFGFGNPYIDLEVTEDIIEKGKALMAGQPFDERVTMVLDLDEDLQLQLFRLAHDRNITFNALMEEILQAAINRAEQVCAETDDK